METMLITGGCGFIGANFVRFLLEQSGFDGRIVSVDKLTYAGNRDNLADLEDAEADRYRFVQADICNVAKMARIFENDKIDMVCHFAAESHVDRSIVAPDAFVKTNIMGTFNLLELAKKHQIDLFHHISTDEVFGSLGADGFFSEQTPYDPSSPYSASKAASDHLVRAYHRTYGLPVTITNCSNNYGPYQFPEKLMPLMILNGLNKKPLPVYGDGRNVRDWLYVMDHCRAVWTVMQKGERGETYNIGGKGELTNIAVVEKICDLLDELQPLSDGGSRRDLITFVKDRPGHDRRYAIDFSKLETELGWQPEESFETGLRKTIDWYLKNPDWIKRVQNGSYREWIKQQYD